MLDLLVRFLLAGALVWSAGAKLARPEAARDFVAASAPRMSRASTFLVASVSLLEIGVAVGLMFGSVARLSAGTGLGLVSVLTLVLVSGAVAPRQAACGCFGGQADAAKPAAPTIPPTTEMFQAIYRPAGYLGRNALFVAGFTLLLDRKLWIEVTVIWGAAATVSYVALAMWGIVRRRHTIHDQPHPTELALRRRLRRLAVCNYYLESQTLLTPNRRLQGVGARVPRERVALAHQEGQR